MTDFFEQPAPTEPIRKPIPVVDLAAELAEATANQTAEIIEKQGHAFWKCQILRGEIIEVVIDRAYATQSRYPVYTLRELALENLLKDSTIRLIYLAKKLAGAQIISVKTIKPRAADGKN